MLKENRVFISLDVIHAAISVASKTNNGPFLDFFPRSEHSIFLHTPRTSACTRLNGPGFLNGVLLLYMMSEPCRAICLWVLCLCKSHLILQFRRSKNASFRFDWSHIYSHTKLSESLIASVIDISHCLHYLLLPDFRRNHCVLTRRDLSTYRKVW